MNAVTCEWKWKIFDCNFRFWFSIVHKEEEEEESVQWHSQVMLNKILINRFVDLFPFEIYLLTS